MQIPVLKNPIAQAGLKWLFKDKVLAEEVAKKVFKSIEEGLELAKESGDPVCIRFYLGRVINQVNHNFYDYWFALKDICIIGACWEMAFEINHLFLKLLAKEALKNQLDTKLGSEWSYRFRIRKCTNRLGRSLVYRSSANSYQVNSLDVICWRRAAPVNFFKRLTMCFKKTIHPISQNGSIQEQLDDEMQPVDYGEYDFYARAFNWDELLSNWQPCRTLVLGVDPNDKPFTLLLDEDVLEHVANSNIEGDKFFFKSCVHKELIC